ncbi:DUF2164 domain-containing protein [Phenylobacterium sp.]|uniref:DUF2164 domain-containing protein n=1 Tax=Phenylobacterium sp. TaxID=1871053 RepID=UPI0025D9631F|nr:DUF2164 domain-containing protein [Phenylobacterium sp.]
MSTIELPKETRDALAAAMSRYLKDELDLEVAGFDAVFLTDFVTERFGPYFYNQGLADAQAVLSKKLDDLGEAILSLEKRTTLTR